MNSFGTGSGTIPPVAWLDFHAFQGAQTWENTRRRTQNGLCAKAKEGKPIGAARPPFGLRYRASILDTAGLPLKATIHASYEPNPETVDTLIWLFEQNDAGFRLPGPAVARRSEIDRAETNCVADPGFVSGNEVALVAATLERLAEEGDALRGQPAAYAEQAEAERVRQLRAHRASDPCGQARPDGPDEQRRRMLDDLGLVVYLCPATHVDRWE